MKQSSRRVRALTKVYVGHVLRREGEEFDYSGPPAAHLFLELSGGDTAPITTSVPRQGDEESEAKVDSIIDDIL